MDPTRFDALARSAATPATRRAALGALAAGGLLNALGLGRSVPQASAAQDQGQDQNQGQGQNQNQSRNQGVQGGLCVAAFVATVRRGPSAGAALVPGGAPGELRGNLRFSLSDTGALQDADLLLADGSSLPVVGQATGHGLKLRIGFGQGRALVAVGVGAQPVTQCLGPFDGPATGPEVGDLGEWHAAAGVQNLPGAAAGGANQGGTQGGGNRQRGAGQSGNAGQRGNRPAGPATAGGASGGAPAGGSTGGSTGGGQGGQAGGSGCPAGQTFCGPNSGCKDLRTNPEGCGTCDIFCDSEREVCRDGVCVAATCPDGETFCGPFDGCVNLQRDRRNCGTCGTACDLGEDCVNGTCGCVGGRTVCNGACVNTTNDPAHCGACGTACVAGEVCVGSACIPGGIVGTGDPGGTGGAAQTACPNNQEFCGPAIGCVDLFANNAQHCGGCGVVCPSGTCDGGSCTAGPGGACPPNQSDCGDGVCIDLQTDPYDCGTCGTVCQPSEECVGGKCALVDCGVDAAGAPLTNCGVCDDLQTSSINCGKCGTICATGQVCVAGTCTAGTEGGGGCPAGQLLCGTECRDGLPNFGSDGLSCPGGGAPPTGCPAGRELCNGACFPAGACPAAADCPPGQGYCYGLCRDFQTDPGYCGNCNTNCSGQVCAGGQCVSCLEGRSPCGTRCFDLNTDLDNCGFCGNRCGTLCINGTCAEVGPSPIDCGQTGESCADRPCCSGNRCEFGTCYAVGGDSAFPCGTSQDFADCLGICVDTRNDPNFCGSCVRRAADGTFSLGYPCPAGSECRGGLCTSPSPESSNQRTLAPTDEDPEPEPEPADGEPAPTDIEPAPAPDEPVLGDVVLDCAAQGLTDCGGVCVDLESDPFNCGECGVGCGADPCVERVCSPAPVEEAPAEEAPPLVAEAPPAEAPPAEEAPPETLVEEAGAACLATGEACDQANPGACCNGGCGSDGFCT